MADQKADDQKILQDSVQQMIDADIEAQRQSGTASPSSITDGTRDEIAKLMQMYEDDQHPIKSFAREFAMVAPMGIAKGLASPVLVPYHILKTILPDAYHKMTGEPATEIMKTLDGMVGLPHWWANASAAERGAFLGDILGGIGGTGVVGRLAPVAAPEAARKIGATLEMLGNRTKSTLPIGGGYAMMRGIETLNPVEFAGGAAVATAPSILRLAGRKLQSWAIPAGEAMETPAGRFLKLQQDIESAERAGSMQPPMLNSARQRIATTAAELEQRLQKAKFPDELKAIQSEQDRLTSLSDQLDKLTASPAAPPATTPNSGIGSLSPADVQQLQKQGVSENAILRLAGVKEPSASGAGSVKLPTKPTVRNRSLSPGEEAGISELDDFQQQRAGTVDVLPQGNGGFTAPPVLRTAHPVSINTAQGGMGGKVPIEGNVIPSRSSGAIRAGVSEKMSATPSITRNDAISIGMNPDINYLTMKAEVLEEINRRLQALRAGRSTTYATDAAAGKPLTEAYPGLSVRRPDEP